MLSSIRLFVALLFLVLALLVIFQAPTIFLWRFVILVTEYGHYLLFVPLAVLIWELFSEQEPHSNCTLIISVLAIGLFFYPSYQAWWLSRTLTLQLTEAYGSSEIAGPPFSFFHLWFHQQPQNIQVSTFKYAAQDGSELSLDFYRDRSSGRRPCIIVVHGGGWNSGDSHQLSAMNYALARAGYRVAAINYRLAPQANWPAQKEDLESAIHYLRTQADSLQLDPQKLVLLGRSAGGQIILATGYGLNDPGIRGCISLYAPTDMNFAYRYGKEDDILKSRGLVRQFMGGTPDQNPGNYQDASPYSLVTAQSPPTLLIHGTRDELVWYLHAHRLQKIVQGAQRPFYLLEMPWATHAFDINVNGPAGQLSLYSILWFLSIETK